MSILKICGVRDSSGVEISFSSGADLIGFNIYPASRRYIDPERLPSLITPDIRLKSVIVGVNLSFEDWRGIIIKSSPGFVQLHGEENMILCEQLKNDFVDLKIIKKVTVRDIMNFKTILQTADYILLDSDTAEKGGSGISFNWEPLKEIPSVLRSKLFLAGGINPDNIGEALSYDVYGFDSATGSETAPGIKAAEKIRRMAEEIRDYG